MHVLKLGTPQHLEMCQMKIIYRTFHILEIRVWFSTDGVPTEGVFGYRKWRIKRLGRLLNFKGTRGGGAFNRERRLFS